MNALDHYSIPVTGLRNGLHEFDFTIDRDFFVNFQESPVKEGTVFVKLLFDKRPDLYVMSFNISGTVKTVCDRCLEEFDLPIAASPMLLVKFDEKEWEDADVIYILKGTLKLNVARYIYEFINLAVPMVKTHDDAGESCDPEMLRFLDENGDDSTTEADSSSPLRDALKGFNLEN